MLGRAMVTIAGFALIVGISTFAGCYSVMKPLADYGIARQATEQTRIEWDARVEIAQIQADVAKKTSVAFSLFWLMRLTTWTLAGLLVGLVVTVFAKWRESLR